MNAKIERINKDIDKTKGKIAVLQNRLRDQEKQKTHLENAEIVALFRRENLSEDEFAALLRAPRLGEKAPQEELDTEGSGDDEND